MFVVHIKLALGISFPKNATESFGKLFLVGLFYVICQQN